MRGTDFLDGVGLFILSCLINDKQIELIGFLFRRIHLYIFRIKILNKKIMIAKVSELNFKHECIIDGRDKDDR